MNNKLLFHARYPNSGWLSITDFRDESHGGKPALVFISDDMLNHTNTLDNYWNDADLRWRTWSWFYEIRDILNYDVSKNELLLEGERTIVQDIKGWKFYLDNKLEELDTVGEWYMDSINKKVYLYHEGTGPGNELIEGTYRSFGLKVNSASVKNLTFRHQSELGLGIKGRTIVENCIFEGIGSDLGGHALKATYSVKGATVRNNIIRDNLNNAIGWIENPQHGNEVSSVIEYNMIRNTGIIPGYGGEGPWHASGIIIYSGQNIKIRYNKIDHTGYAAIILGHKNNYSEYNVISRAMSTLNDGAGIYTNCDSSIIRYNIVYDTEGDLESSGPWANLGHGIWLEFLSDFQGSVVENNTCYNNGSAGIYLPNNFYCTLKNNVLYNNKNQLSLGGKETNTQTGRTENKPQHNTITGNILYAVQPGQWPLSFKNQYDYGNFSGNFLGNPHDYFVAKAKDYRDYFSLDHMILRWQWFKNNKTDLFKRTSYSMVDSLTGNYILNSDFEDDTLTWIYNKDSSYISIVNDQELMDNRCLEILADSGKTDILYSSTFQVDSGAYYRLKFSYRTDSLGYLDNKESRRFSVSVRKNKDWKTHGKIDLPTRTFKEEVDFIFRAEQATTDKGIIQISLKPSSRMKFYFDNITLYKVNAEKSVPADSSILLVNDTGEEKALTVPPGTWTDVHGNEKKGSVSLAPFTSMVLISNPFLINKPPSLVEDPLTITRHYNSMITLYPNPTNDYVHLASKEKMVTVAIYDINGKIQKVISLKTGIKEVNVGDLEQGVYVLKTMDENGKIYHGKLIID